MFTSESLSIGAFTHSMVKGLSRGKFAAVNFYSGTLPRCFAVTGTHLPRLISVFMQLFSRETLEGLLEREGFSVLKTVDMQDKNKNITQMVKVEFLKLRNQVNERVNLNSNLPCKKKKNVYIYIYI